MSESEPAAGVGTPPRNLWTIVGVALVVSVLLLVIAGAVLALSVRDSELPISTTRVMIENFAAVAASVVSAALLLGATLALTEAARSSAQPARLRPWFAVVFAIGAVIVVACALVIWEVATVNTNSLSNVGAFGPEWKQRLSRILPFVAAALLALVALVLAQVRAPFSESRASEVSQPD